MSRKYLGAADLILYCEEGTGSGERFDRERDEFLTNCQAPVVRVRTKVDQLPGNEPVGVSTVTGEGLDVLRKRLAEVAFGKLLSLGDVEPVVTRARHRVALEQALEELDAFQAARERGVDAAAAATHLRAAVGACDDLIGAVTPDDVLDRVFASFCVGK